MAPPGSAILNWTPDLPTIQQLLNQAKEECPDCPITELIYPGHGLSWMELEELRLYFGQIEKWTTFRDAMRRANDGNSGSTIAGRDQILQGKVLGLSISDGRISSPMVMARSI